MATVISRREWLLTLGGLARAQSGLEGDIRRLAESAPLRMRFGGGSAEACREWQRAFRAKLGELLGPYEPPRRWETIRERSVELEDHRREELLLRAEGCRDLPVYLLIPRGEVKRPGVLALHGHGQFGHDPVVGIVEQAAERYDYGLQLVRRGYVVAAPCFTPFGRRLEDRKAYRGEDPCGVTFVRLQLLGKLLIAENLRDALWSLALLAAHPQVDGERLGCVGLSYGGRLTMLAAALAPQIRVAVISGALNLMQERIRGRYSCGAQAIPSLLEWGDVPEIASLIAPRPCLWEVGRQDGLMVKEWLEPALERIRRAYGALGALEALDVDSFEGGHRWNGVKAYPLLEKKLLAISR